MSYWWLSFADPERPAGAQFLGVAIVDAEDFIGAVLSARFGGYNPGGEVAGYQYIADGLDIDPPAEYLGRLLTKDEANAVDAKMAELYKAQARPMVCALFTGCYSEARLCQKAGHCLMDLRR